MDSVVYARMGESCCVCVGWWAVGGPCCVCVGGLVGLGPRWAVLCMRGGWVLLGRVVYACVLLGHVVYAWVLLSRVVYEWVGGWALGG